MLLLHYAGHGSNVPDSSGDEADHRDEILCPTDLDWKDPLLDDWMGELFDTLPADTALTFVSDSCHSGSVNRELLPPDSTKAIPRYLPCPLDLLATESGRELRGTLRRPRLARAPEVSARALKGRAPAAPSSDFTDLGVPEVLISGCSDSQTAADAFIKGAFHGALTYALVQVIREAGGVLTYRELHQRATAILKRSTHRSHSSRGVRDDSTSRSCSPLGQSAVPVLESPLALILQAGCPVATHIVLLGDRAAAHRRRARRPCRRPSEASFIAPQASTRMP